MPLRARLLAILLTGPALGPQAGARQPDAPVRETITSFLRAETAGLAGEVGIEVGAVDPANLLPPCTALAAFLPAGQRAWGAVSVGVRCEAPAPWTIYVPARVRVSGSYLVLARPLRPGQIVAPDDLARRLGDLAAEGDGAMLDAAQAIGRPARIAVAAGQPLRRDMLRLPPVVRRGEPVRVVSSGAGFAVANEGRALNDAAEGHSVRVRLESGRVLSGTARHDGVVEIAQ